MTAAANIDIATPDEYDQLIAALTHDRSALARMMRSPFGAPIRFHRSLSFTTDDNTAAASSPVLNLTDLGVAFDTDKESDIYVEVVAANGANRFKFTTVQRVLGGTNPTLKGITRFLTECEAHYGFTTADGTTTTEDATACIGPEWWDGASPVAGNVSSNNLTIQWLGGNFAAGLILPRQPNNFDAAAIVGDSRVYQHGNVSLTNGTSDVTVSDNAASPALANWSNGSVVRVSARILPPIECPVLIDTAPTPDKVFIGAKGLSSDLVTWNVHVYVTDQRRMPLL
jgi:hypothetical protein